jgi:Flp pilus assembly protein TadB
MTDAWKSFWRGLLSGVLAVLGTIGAFLLWRRRSPEVGSPEEIATEAEAKIEEVRQEIKSDSDQALADRFNSLAKKEEKKG